MRPHVALTLALLLPLPAQAQVDDPQPGDPAPPELEDVWFCPPSEQNLDAEQAGLVADIDEDRIDEYSFGDVLEGRAQVYCLSKGGWGGWGWAVVCDGSFVYRCPYLGGINYWWLEDGRFHGLVIEGGDTTRPEWEEAIAGSDVDRNGAVEAVSYEVLKTGKLRMTVYKDYAQVAQAEIDPPQSPEDLPWPSEIVPPDTPHPPLPSPIPMWLPAGIAAGVFLALLARERRLLALLAGLCALSMSCASTGGADGLGTGDLYLVAARDVPLPDGGRAGLVEIRRGKIGKPKAWGRYLWRWSARKGNPPPARMAVVDETVLIEKLHVPENVYFRCELADGANLELTDAADPLVVKATENGKWANEKLRFDPATPLLPKRVQFRAGDRPPKELLKKLGL